jgi:hypothetical protein
MLTASPSSQVKPQQWGTCGVSVASTPALLPPPAAGRLVAVETRRRTRTVASAALGPVATEPAERSPVPQVRVRSSVNYTAVFNAFERSRIALFLSAAPATVQRRGDGAPARQLRPGLRHAPSKLKLNVPPETRLQKIDQVASLSNVHDEHDVAA